jgi:hypothetical protein
MSKKTETVDKDISEEGTIRQTNSSTLDGLSLKTINNLVEFIVIYVDSRLTTSVDCQSLLSNLQSIISDEINHFYDIKESLEFIESKDKTTMKIFVIMSGTLAENHGEKFAELSQVECIYIFCRYQEWSHTGNKIRGIYQDKTKLLLQLTRDTKELANRWQFIEESSFQNESTDECRWHHLFIKILLSLPSTEEAQQDMVEESKSFYKGNEAMEKKIEQFQESYKACKAINYYIEDSLVYRIINYALRTQNFDKHRCILPCSLECGRVTAEILE